MSPVLIVIFRWLHIIPAALAIGGLVFMRARRGFKIMLHASILFLIISGTINSIRYYPEYAARKPLAFALWHTHMTLAVLVFIISFWNLAGKQAPPSNRGAAMVNVILLLVLVALASTLSMVRQRPAGDSHSQTQSK